MLSEIAYTHNHLPGDAPEHACGIFGLWAPGRSVALDTYYALVTLQHRGQESAGIVVANGKKMGMKRGMGLVNDVFSAEDLLDLQGYAAIGHVRYSTTGTSSFLNTQPLLIRYKQGELAIAHNGNIVNSELLRKQLEQTGSIFQSTIDCEVFAHLIACSKANILEEALAEAARKVLGGYAIIFLQQDKLVALRDPNGIRPLMLGLLDGKYMVASESCVFDTLGGSFLREIGPGEMVVISEHGLQSYQVVPPSRFALCAFEYIYFARPDSDIEGLNTHAMRKQLGQELAKESYCDADIVCGVPDSSISAAIGYAEEANLPFEMALVKNRYMGRTFIKPTQEQREISVKLKLNPVRKLVAGKRVLLVDDSIVRGTTMSYIISLLREVGAREIHVRITSPPYRYPCYFGIDTSARGDLIASSRTIDEIRQEIGADSLHYLHLETLSRVVAAHGLQVCMACFNRDYPVSIDDCSISAAIKEDGSGA